MAIIAGLNMAPISRLKKTVRFTNTSRTNIFNPVNSIYSVDFYTLVAESPNS